MRIVLAAPVALFALASTCQAGERAAEPLAQDCERPPEVIAAVAPEFPDLPWKARIGGEQWVSVDIGEAGEVLHASLASEAKAHFGFDQASLVAARKCRFGAAPGCPARAARLLFRFIEPVSQPESVGVTFHPPFEIAIAVAARTIDVKSH